MRKILLVARRDYLEHVRTRSFIVGILLLPILVTGSVFIQRLLEGAETGGSVVLVDAGAGLGGMVAQAYGKSERFPLEVETADPGGVDGLVEQLSAKVRAKELVAFLVLEPGMVEGTGGTRFYTDNLSREEPQNALAQAVTNVVREKRFQSHEVDPAVVEDIYRPVANRDFSVSEKAGATEVGQKAREAKQWIPMVFVYLMFIGIMGQSQTMLTSTVEEKSNRVMEVLLSSVTPFQLMAGKMIGLGLVSLTLFAVWMCGGAYMIVYHHLQSLISLSTLGYFLAFFVPGFLIYAAIMAALGSVCNDLKEAQNMMTPVMVIMIVPLMIMFWVGRNPDHPLGVILSYVPLFTPFLMINRISSALPPSGIEIAAGIAVLLVAIAITVWFAARVFRVGVLLYGKPPTFREVFRWMREA